VAADGCSGKPWRAQGRTTRRSYSGEQGWVDAWGGRAGGGRRRPARQRPRGAAPAAEGSRAGEQRAKGAQRKKMRGKKSKGSCVKLKRSRDFSIK
jgi:hypothetical protein